MRLSLMKCPRNILNPPPLLKSVCVCMCVCVRVCVISVCALVYHYNSITSCYKTLELKREDLQSDSTEYASAISLKTLSASSRLSGFLSGCHLRAILRYLQMTIGSKIKTVGRE